MLRVESIEEIQDDIVDVDAIDAQPAIPEVLISAQLSPDLKQIAYTFKELKESAIRVSEGAKELLPLLRRAQQNADDHDDKILKEAIAHYEKLATHKDSWPEVTTDSLKDEGSIYKLLLAIEEKLNNRAAFFALEQRQECYVWVSINIPKLRAILSKQKLSDEDKQCMSKHLMSPSQRLTKLELFAKNVVEQAKNGEHENIRSVIERLMFKIRLINAELNKMLVDHADLVRLKRKIARLEDGDEFKNALNQLCTVLEADIKLMQAKGFSSQKIESSPAVKLCQHTDEMLGVLVSSDAPNKAGMDAVKKYERVTSQSRFLPFLKFIGAVLIAAAVTVVVAAMITGVCAVVGTLCGGPAGLVVGSVAGLLQGVSSGAAVGIAAASAVTGVGVGLYAAGRMFTSDPKVAAASDVASQAQRFSMSINRKIK